ncbi:hypothetical protein X471_01222 [Bartonella bacilliformis str. Heidi Mejia]|uniref:Uncharacterized protein n=3 Tax=Bartonella bacilliformis TaxID=774 RepID=A1UTQ9_BARBK|nr:Trm112 family protein [Bartonella bacilliformis]ABM44552.1 conserved hypothetical protein [Bartonella bacilliformis KC583]EKS43620.1 hypothetical protein BbINS_05147 [Bartonella bacilliformis INS]EYS88662.1 hypothetical protein X472_01214 [Bartonella bacilliformis San Pedro600-02]EYS90515.1 hypothetical protein X471_01222 [Bartonella bacilliformis str. Heidi Mejia]EYS94464.1 hypothetical protein X470_01063 [Bartonella bacilliformis Peru-18]
MKKMTTDPKMLELLVCPITGGNLSFNRKTQELISLKANFSYLKKRHKIFLTTMLKKP